MDREIKFRGKTLYDHYTLAQSRDHYTKEGTWVYGDLITECPYHKGLTIVENGVYHEVDPETVGQYTGLKDKNGVEIFEGDFVRHKSSPFAYEVVWHGGAFRLSNNPHHHTLLNRLEGCEVIGNIHDNPELLGVD